MKNYLINLFASLLATILIFIICFVTPISWLIIYYFDSIFMKLFLITVFLGTFSMIYKTPVDDPKL